MASLKPETEALKTALSGKKKYKGILYLFGWGVGGLHLWRGGREEEKRKKSKYLNQSATRLLVEGLLLDS